MLSCTIAPSCGPSRAPPRLCLAADRLESALGGRSRWYAGLFVRGVRPPVPSERRLYERFVAPPSNSTLDCRMECESGARNAPSSVPAWL
jgi:hypothetical protein